MLFFMS